jgi:hypothetical protein
MAGRGPVAAGAAGCCRKTLHSSALNVCAGSFRSRALSAHTSTPSAARQSAQRAQLRNGGSANGRR